MYDAHGAKRAWMAVEMEKESPDFCPIIGTTTSATALKMIRSLPSPSHYRRPCLLLFMVGHVLVTASRYVSALPVEVVEARLKAATVAAVGITVGNSPVACPRVASETVTPCLDECSHLQRPSC